MIPSKIIQVIPCKTDLFAIYDTENGGGRYERIEYLGLYKNGSLTGLTLDPPFGFVPCENVEGFRTLCKPSELDSYMTRYCRFIKDENA